jgi:hypothetical protein
MGKMLKKFSALVKGGERPSVEVVDTKGCVVREAYKRQAINMVKAAQNLQIPVTVAKVLDKEIDGLFAVTVHTTTSDQRDDYEDEFATIDSDESF